MKKKWKLREVIEMMSHLKKNNIILDITDLMLRQDHKDVRLLIHTNIQLIEIKYTEITELKLYRLPPWARNLSCSGIGLS